jgi:hypothetical protein
MRLSFNAWTLYLPWSQIRAGPRAKYDCPAAGPVSPQIDCINDWGRLGLLWHPIYWRELSPIDVSGMSCLKLSGSQVMLYCTRIGMLGAPVRWLFPEPALDAKIDMIR